MIQNYDSRGGVHNDHFPSKTPYFIQYSETIENEEYLSNTLEQATIEDIKNYLARESQESLSQELEYYFTIAERYYQEAQHTESEEKQIKRLLKSIKK